MNEHLTCYTFSLLHDVAIETHSGVGHSVIEKGSYRLFVRTTVKANKVVTKSYLVECCGADLIGQPQWREAPSIDWFLMLVLHRVSSATISPRVDGNRRFIDLGVIDPLAD